MGMLLPVTRYSVTRYAYGNKLRDLRSLAGAGALGSSGIGVYNSTSPPAANFRFRSP